MPRKQQDEIVRQHIAAVDQLRLFEFAKRAGDAYLTFIEAVRHAPEHAPQQVTALASTLREELTHALAPAKSEATVKVRRIKRKIEVPTPVASAGDLEVGKDGEWLTATIPGVGSVAGSVVFDPPANFNTDHPDDFPEVSTGEEG